MLVHLHETTKPGLAGGSRAQSAKGEEDHSAIAMEGIDGMKAAVVGAAVANGQVAPPKC